MKWGTVFVLAVLFCSALCGYQWTPLCSNDCEVYAYCPSVVGLYQHILGCEDGLLLYNGDEWEHVQTFLPVWDVLPWDASHVIFIQGDGSYSDGVWLLDLYSHEVTVLDWFVFPRFLVYAPHQDGWYLGTYNGLYFSSDGSSWTAQPFFSGMGCFDMTMQENHYLITVQDDDNHIYYSDDYGVTWEGSANVTLPLQDVEFYYDGSAWGIFPGYSNSSGLYKSDDYGANWQVAAWSDDANSVCIAPGGFVFMGWESDGVAQYANNDLSFMNTGLPCLNINRLYVNPAMSIMHLMALTDSGVYMLTDFTSAQPPLVSPPAVTLSNYPNPFNPSTEIRFQLSDASQLDHAQIEIFNVKGQKVRKLEMKRDLSCSITWDGTDSNNQPVASGMYLYQLRAGNQALAQKKMMLLK
jgi:hypothetical protein